MRMNISCEHFLADAGFTADENRNVRIGDVLGDFFNAQHFWIRRENVARLHIGIELTLQRLDFFPELLLFDDILDRQFQFLLLERLHQKIGRTHFHSIDDGLCLAGGGKNDHGDGGIDFLNALKYLNAVDARHHDIENHQGRYITG